MPILELKNMPQKIIRIPQDVDKVNYSDLKVGTTHYEFDSFEEFTRIIQNHPNWPLEYINYYIDHEAEHFKIEKFFQKQEFKNLLNHFGVELAKANHEKTQKRHTLIQIEVFIQSYKNDNGTLPLTEDIMFEDGEVRIRLTPSSGFESTSIAFLGDASEYCYFSDSYQYSIAVKLDNEVSSRGNTLKNCFEN